MSPPPPSLFTAPSLLPASPAPPSGGGTFHATLKLAESICQQLPFGTGLSPFIEKSHSTSRRFCRVALNAPFCASWSDCATVTVPPCANHIGVQPFMSHACRRVHTSHIA